MNPDGLSYLDLASDALHGGPGKLLNAYWSPGYPALISLALLVFHPSPAQEFPVVHLVNFIIFAFTLWAFTVFLRYLLAVTGARVMDVDGDRQGYLTPFFFGTFLYFALTFIGTEVVTPDLWVAAIILLAAGIGCRLMLPGADWRHGVALGFALGIGYYVKAAMFPLAVIFLILLFILAPAAKVSRRVLLLSASVFLLAAAPLVVAMTARMNRLTFGDTGRLNYIWYVNGLHWNDGLEPVDPAWTREHPAPTLLGKPLTYSFASPIGGTYPLWYDPSYWYVHAKLDFSLRRQIGALRDTMQSYKDMAKGMIVFVAGCIVLLGLTAYYGFGPAVSPSLWPISGWAVGAFAMYALVHVEDRFLGAFFILFWLGIYTGMIVRLKREAVVVCSTVLLTIMFPFAADLARGSASLVRSVVASERPEYVQIALGLRQLGLRAGDGLAVVGYAYDCYYARYGRMRVVAQIPDAREFWQLSPPEARSAAEKLASSGVRAVIAFNRPGTPDAGMWKDVTLTDSRRLSVLLLPPGVESGIDPKP